MRYIKDFDHCMCLSHTHHRNDRDNIGPAAKDSAQSSTCIPSDLNCTTTSARLCERSKHIYYKSVTLHMHEIYSMNKLCGIRSVYIKLCIYIGRLGGEIER